MCKKSTMKIRQCCHRVYKKKCVWREENTGIRCSEPLEHFLPSGTRWRTATASSSSSSDSGIATHYLVRSSRQVYTNIYCTSFSSVQVYQVVTIIDQVQALCCESAHGVNVTKNEKNKWQRTEQQQQHQQHYVYIKLAFRLLRRHFNNYRWSYIVLN